MTEQDRTEIDRLAVPVGDGEILVWPRVDGLQQLAIENRRRRAVFDFELAGRSVAEFITIGQLRGPVIMTGHQPTFFHPGVWAKGVAATALASRIGGRAELVVVDSDAVHGLGLNWPWREATGTWRVCRSRPFTVPRDVPFEHLPVLSPAVWERFFGEAIAACRWADHGTMLGAFVEGFQGPGTGERDQRGPYVGRWVEGARAVDRMLGLPPLRFSMVSALFSARSEEAAAAGEVGASLSRAAWAFLAHLLLHAERFAVAYNESLAAYRRRCGFSGQRHPIPDLAVEAGRAELPFWVMTAAGTRQRLFAVAIATDQVGVQAGTEPILVMPRRAVWDGAGALWARQAGDWVIRPRALALTMFLRLLACDLFVHGLGGAKYDQITDGVIRRFFEVEPPGYACVTATQHLPLGGNLAVATEADRRAARRRLRDVRFNPQRYAGGGVAEPVRRFLEQRARGVAESIRLGREDRANKAGRRAAFEMIRRASQAVHLALPRLMEEARDDLALVEARSEETRITQSREWFFALYPAEKLRALAGALGVMCKPVGHEAVR